jgi:hypothetical protein
MSQASRGHSLLQPASCQWSNHPTLTDYTCRTLACA